MGKTIASQIITVTIFIISYILIFSGKIERTVASLLGLFVLLSFGYAFGFLNFEDVLMHVDWEVILLLFGMMTYVGILAKTGFFKYIGIKAIKMTHGNSWLIFLYLGLITTFISMIIDNVTTILLIIPLTVEIAEMLEVNPIPIMLGEAILSNVGGVATMVGDPPNIMIAFASGYTFNDFIAYLFFPVMTSLFLSIIIARVVYRKWVKKQGKNIDKILQIDARKYIRGRKKMRLLLYVLIGMIAFFATESYTHISPSFVAVAGATFALLITMEEPREAFSSVEWSTLVFFIALFSLVGGLQEVGVLDGFANWIAGLSGNVITIAIIILWVTGLTSSFVDNIPITAAMIPVVAALSHDLHTGLLWWALAMGVGMGGNITPIGSSAGVIAISLSKRYGHEIKNKDWLRFGTLVGIASMAVCTVFLLIM